MLGQLDLTLAVERSELVVGPALGVKLVDEVLLDAIDPFYVDRAWLESPPFGQVDSCRGPVGLQRGWKYQEAVSPRHFLWRYYWQENYLLRETPLVMSVLEG